MEPEPLDGRINLGLESTADGPKDTIVWQRGGRGSERSTGTGSAHDVLTKEFLRKYIHYARNRVKPVLSDEAIDAISVAYADMRSKQTPKNLPITARSLETIIRLASAHAKSRLSNTVNEYDVEEVLELMNYVLFHEIGSYSTPKSVLAEPVVSDRLVPSKRKGDAEMELDDEEDGEEHKASPGSGDKRSKKTNAGEEEDDEGEEIDHYISGTLDRSSPRYLCVQTAVMKLASLSGLYLFQPRAHLSQVVWGSASMPF
jgi:DNA replicative helicase MCM subunit Mcm2 (Cdc46/Mcm family)